MTESLGHPNTAIHIWSGFVYQGKVALYYVVRLLKDDKNSLAAVRLDSLEDFVVLNDQDEIVSLHQVKAQAEGVISSYNDNSGKSAFEKLKENAQRSRCSKAFIHLANKITDKSEEDISRTYAPVKLYQYNGSCECSVGSIDAAIEGIIEQFFIKYHSGETWRTETDYLKKTRIFLCEIIQEKVLSTHMKGQLNAGTMRAVAATEKIDFSRILGVLESDLSLTATSQQYYLYLIRQDLRRYYDEFVDKVIGDEAILRKLTDYMIIIESLDKHDIVSFIKNITPHREIKCSSLEEYRDNTLVRDEVHLAFFRILQEMREAGFKNETNTFIWEKNGRCFYPTTIHHGPSNSGDICKNIIDNALKNDLDLMFEKDCLITTDIEVESVLDTAPRVSELEFMSEATESYKKIMNWKNVSLVSLERAKGEVND